MKLDPASAPLKTGSIYPAPFAAMMAGRASKRLGEAGGLSQFGVNLVILAPGALSSLRHWHLNEDEFVMVLAGSCTLVDDEGRHEMQPGDCAAFPAGVANGHHFLNETGAEARFLVVGSKAAREVATYSDHDLMVTIEAGRASFTGKDGAPTGRPGATTILRADIIAPLEAGTSCPEVFDNGSRFRCWPLGEVGKLTQFGIAMEVLEPGPGPSLHHWHETEDEVLYLLEGELTVIEGEGAEESRYVLHPGEAAAWPAGLARGHSLVNHTDAPATYLILGTRAEAERTHYPGLDLACGRAGGVSTFSHLDGTPYPPRSAKD